VIRDEDRHNHGVICGARVLGKEIQDVWRLEPSSHPDINGGAPAVFHPDVMHPCASPATPAALPSRFAPVRGRGGPETGPTSSIPPVAYGGADVRACQADVLHNVVHRHQLTHIAPDAQLVRNRSADPRHAPGHEAGERRAGERDPERSGAATSEPVVTMTVLLGRWFTAMSPEPPSAVCDSGHVASHFLRVGLALRR
jgi:hypothetical protein